MNMLKERRTVTNAEVLGRYTEEFESPYDYDREPHISYYVDIRFNVSDKQYIINAEVSNKIYENAERGNTLKIAYAKSEPRVLIFEGEDWI